ncbi:MAG: hypothetical protein ACRD0P_13970, partial [Stackebrandtia sp.]
MAKLTDDEGEELALLIGRAMAAYSRVGQLHGVRIEPTPTTDSHPYWAAETHNAQQAADEATANLWAWVR